MEKYTVFGTMLGISIICFLMGISDEIENMKDRLFLFVAGIVFLISSYIERKI